MEYTLDMLSDEGLEYLLNKYRKQMIKIEGAIDKIIIEQNRRQNEILERRCKFRQKSD